MGGRDRTPRFQLRAVARSGGGLRWIAELDPATARRYREAVAPALDRIERALGPTVLANRARPDGRLHPSGPAWGRWRRALQRAAAERATVIVSDVRDCYGSITAPAVLEALAILDVPSSTAAEIAAVLTELRNEGLRGLPVGPDPSAILANAVLAGADRAVRDAGARVLRWVDDVAIAGPDRRTTVRAFDAWAASLRAAGLTPHDGKTRLLGPEDGSFGAQAPQSCGGARGMMLAP